MTKYEEDIKNRTTLRFFCGCCTRIKRYIYFSLVRSVARMNGAIIGKNVCMPFKLAKQANHNLTIGDNVVLQTELIDLRNHVTIGNNVIIGLGTEIITTSHNIDSPDWEHKHYGIIIEDYTWIPTKVLVLPSCRHIGVGAVIGSGSVVVKDVESLTVVSGNPAIFLKKRKCVHTDLCVESMWGGDFLTYIKARFK